MKKTIKIPSKIKKMKVAIVHDYLREYGGAERVVEALHELFPTADVYVAFVDKEALGIHWRRFADWTIYESWITKIPFYKKLFSPLRFLAPNFFEAFDLSKYDLVISSSNMYFAKAVLPPKKSIHISYCHTPPRSLYGYTTMTDWKKNPIIRVGGTLINHYLRLVDYKVSQRVPIFLANSKEVQKRINKFYRRDSTIVYPPVNLPEKAPSSNRKGKYYLYVGRLAKSKHVDLAVKACAQLDVPLRVVGAGKGLDYLKELAGPQTGFLGAVSDEQLEKIYQDATAVIFPAEDEDFGIVPVEAMGHGVPVIAHKSGGPLETIVDGKTGVFFDDLTVKSLVKAIKKSQKIKFSATQIYKHSQKFSKESFWEGVLGVVEEKCKLG